MASRRNPRRTCRRPHCKYISGIINEKSSHNALHSIALGRRRRCRRIAFALPLAAAALASAMPAQDQGDDASASRPSSSARASAASWVSLIPQSVSATMAVVAYFRPPTPIAQQPAADAPRKASESLLVLAKVLHGVADMAENVAEVVEGTVYSGTFTANLLNSANVALNAAEMARVRARDAVEIAQGLGDMVIERVWQIELYCKKESCHRTKLPVANNYLSSDVGPTSDIFFFFLLKLL